MKCILHIGTEKTATTTLQYWLYDNRLQLSKVGLYLSDNLGKPNNRKIPAYFQDHFDDYAMRNGYSSNAEKALYFKGFIERLKSEIEGAEKTQNYFVISSEFLHSRVRKVDEIERLHDFLSSVFDELEVVCYFRDQFDVVISLYSTALRGNSQASVESFVEQAKPENYYFNYLQIADNWAGVFGPSNCNFRIYDRSKFTGGDIRLDFLSVVDKGIDTATLNMDTSQRNESLTALQGAAFRALNRNTPYWRNDKHRANQDNLNAKKMIAELDSLKLGRITSTKGDLVKSRFAKLNSLFFEKYFTVNDSFPMTQFESSDFLTLDDACSAVEDAFECGLKIGARTAPSLAEEHIDSVRDIALRIFEHRPHSVEDALSLMQIALSHRPNGPLIKTKVEQWSALLPQTED